MSLCVSAHARLMFRETVTVEDAVVVVSVMECSMQVVLLMLMLLYIPEAILHF